MRRFEQILTLQDRWKRSILASYRVSAPANAARIRGRHLPQNLLGTTVRHPDRCSWCHGVITRRQVQCRIVCIPEGLVVSLVGGRSKENELPEYH